MATDKLCTCDLSIKGMVFDIQRMCIHDGPGIRTTVFLKGCPLHCTWCHNPEGISPQPQLYFSAALCITCGNCVKVCDQGAHNIRDGVHTFDRSKCSLCLRCVPFCPTGALEKVGYEISVEQVLQEVEKDRAFYETSGGGMTISGGEPLQQAEFTYHLLLGAKQRNFHTCLETSGFGVPASIRMMSEVTDLFLLDFKESDPQQHRKFTGKPNDFFHITLEVLQETNSPFILRCLIVPEIHVRESHLWAIAQIGLSYPNCQGIELISYHSLGYNKHKRLGSNSLPPMFSEPDEELQAQILDYLKASGFENVQWS